MTTPSISCSTLVGGSDDNSDDFVMLDAASDLAIRPGKPEKEHATRLELNTLPSNNAVLISIHPPSHPSRDVSHVPCDIVLVIDVSGSMATLAPLPDTKDEKEQEAAGLTVLDLVRHASRTILSTLNQNDRLAIVTFSNEASVVQPLTIMTATAKAETSTKIDQLTDSGMTNLWAGIKTGLQLFERNPPDGKVQGLFVLTDGRPNYMCPPQGYIPKLEPLLDNLKSANGSHPTIQTFGFGYDIRSDLMLSIAKAGNGNFAFIPEVGMIGTVFVHAVANLYATYATNAVLVIDTTRLGSNTLSHESGLPTGRIQKRRSSQFFVNLGSMLYGQSRDVIVHCKPDVLKAKVPIQVQLTYSIGNKTEEIVRAEFSLNKPSTLSQKTIAYHLIRHELCGMLSSLYPVGATGEHYTAAVSAVGNKMVDFQTLVEHLLSIPDCTSDPNLSSLVADLIGPEFNSKTPELGQVYQALQIKSPDQSEGSRPQLNYWEIWGRHYLSSLWCAHMRQMCNSFKDPGPLRYGVDSAIFKKCRDELDSAFDNLPPPKGTWRGNSASRHRQSVGVGGQQNGPQANASSITSTSTSTPTIRMSRWNRRDNPCFLGSCPVKLATDGGQIVTVGELRPDMMIEAPLTSGGNSKKARKVVLITRTFTRPGDEVCRVGSEGLWVTPWHPIFDQHSKQWVFPHDVADETKTLHDNEPVFSIMLEPSDTVDDHAVTIGGVPCVTLGHGLVDSNVGDIRAHPFFGNRALIRANLANFPTDTEGRTLVSHALKDARSGLTSWFCSSSTTLAADAGENDEGIPAEWAQQLNELVVVRNAALATTMTENGLTKTMGFPSPRVILV